MASTIKLKTSTSSGNVPASLSKGEVAINVADGVWYYGGNSAVQQNFTFGRITVTGDTNLDGKLVVTGNTVMNGTLSATTRLQVGNGDGLISGHTTSSINSTVGNVLNITGGDGAITFEGASSIKIPDNTSSALVIEEANNAYLSFFTTNASPVIQVHQPQVHTNTLTVGVDGTGHDVKFFGDTAGQYMLWDESADKLIVTGEIEATKFDGALEGNADTATKIASITNDNIVQLAGAQTLTGTKTLNSFKGTGSVTVTDIKDTDNFSDASATSLATSESIKAYVDSKDHDANTLQEVTTAGATSNVAITLSNDLTVGVDDTGHDVKFFGATSGAYMLWDQSADDLIIAGAGGLSVDGVTNLDNTDIEGTFTMDGTTFDVNGTTRVAIDNTNTTNGIEIGTSTSGVPIQLGHSTSETRVNDNLVVTGNTVMNGTLSATTSCKIGNGDGLISAATVSAPVITGTLSTASQPNITSVGELTALQIDNISIDGDTITASGDLAIIATGNDITVDTDTFIMSSATSLKPVMTLKSTADSNKPPSLVLSKVRASTTAADNDYIGTVYMKSSNDAGEDITYAEAVGYILDASDGVEEGKYSIGVKAHTPGLANGLVVTGNGSGIADVALGSGTGSIVTIPGDIDVDGTSNLDNTDIEGTLVVDGSNISLDSTSTLNIDNTNTTNGITIGTATSGVPIQLGHSTSETRVNDNLVVTGNTVLNGTLSAVTSITTSGDVLAGTGVDDGVISAGTVNGAYQLICFVGNSGALSDDNWQYPGTNGISNYTWGYSADGDGISTGSSTFSIVRTKQMSGIVLPAGTRIVGITGALRSSTNDTAYAGLFTYSPNYGTPDTVQATLRILAQSVDNSGGASVTNDGQFFKGDAAFASQYVVQEGDQILPAFRRNSSSSQSVIGSFTIIVKY